MQLSHQRLLGLLSFWRKKTSPSSASSRRRNWRQLINPIHAFSYSFILFVFFHTRSYFGSKTVLLKHSPKALPTRQKCSFSLSQNLASKRILKGSLDVLLSLVASFHRNLQRDWLVAKIVATSAMRLLFFSAKKRTANHLAEA